MSGRSSAHGDKLRQVLSDGLWHTLDELVDVTGDLIPEGRAERRAETERQRRRGRDSYPPPSRQQGDRDRAVASGRRRIVRRTLASMDERGFVERRTVGGRLEYRKASR